MARSDNDDYRSLTGEEIEILEHRGSTAQDWKNIRVKEGFDPAKISRCRFYGHLRIGQLDDIALQAGAVALPVGINESTLINCRIGDNVAIYRVSYLSGYIVGNKTLIKDVAELSVSDTPTFGEMATSDSSDDSPSNEDNSTGSEIEVINENGSRAIYPFSGMWTADAHLWAKERGRAVLMKKLKEFTRQRIASHKEDPASAYPFGSIGSDTLVDGLVHGRDIIIGDSAVVEGPLGLIDVTISSSSDAPAKIGRGVELSHGIAGFGCNVHTGARASHFVLADHTTLSLGARLSHTYLGENSTISCCEVSHSLILPFHEQHHNSSFLIAALVEGQSNIAAGATLGSNHSSRRADGEILCRRGFWPGLTASIKHPSYFASFSLLTKEDYPHEMNIPLPFSLISRSRTDGGIVILPAFWFLYNRYALERNSRKFRRRDHRTLTENSSGHTDTVASPDHTAPPSDSLSLPFVYEALAPDTAEETVGAMELLAEWTLDAWLDELGKERLPGHLRTPQMSSKDKGRYLLENYPEECGKLHIKRSGIEKSKVPTRILKVPQAYSAYRKAVHLYAVKIIDARRELTETVLKEMNSSGKFEPIEGGETDERSRTEPNNSEKSELFKQAPYSAVKYHWNTEGGWINLGGTLIPRADKNALIEDVEKGSLNSWEDIHQRYRDISSKYHSDIIRHALLLLKRIGVLSKGPIPWKKLRSQAAIEQDELAEAVKTSREKDFTEEFRNITFSDSQEKEAVLGRMEGDPIVTH
ncbi:MAG: DUF4954 family protein [Spirochaetia bacterium]